MVSQIENDAISFLTALACYHVPSPNAAVWGLDMLTRKHKISFPSIFQWALLAYCSADLFLSCCKFQMVVIVAIRDLTYMSFTCPLAL